VLTVLITRFFISLIFRLIIPGAEWLIKANCRLLKVRGDTGTSIKGNCPATSILTVVPGIAGYNRDR